MKKLCLGFVFFLLSSCGLPDSEDMEDLNPPLGLSVDSVQCSAGVPTGVVLRFYGYNPEAFFSGYNIYLAKDNVNAENDLQSYVTNHIISPSDADPYFNESIEKNYMTRNDYNEFPSIGLDDLSGYSGYQGQPTEIVFTLKRTAQNMDNGSFNLGSSYTFGLTAISLSSKRETVLSNVATQTISCP